MKKRLQISLWIVLCAFLPRLAVAQANSCTAPVLLCSEDTHINYALSALTVADFNDDYGCLDPWGPVGKSWHYVKTSEIGEVELVVQGTASIGAAVWGPFSSLTAAQAMCGNLPTPKDCDIVSDEFALVTVNATAADQIFLLFVMSESTSATFNFGQHNASDPNSGSVVCNPIVEPPVVPNADCPSPAPICGDNAVVHYPLTYETAVSSANAYGCLDPWGPKGKAWHYVEVSQTGYLQFTIGSDGPIGAAIWGSFPDVASAEAACGSLTTPFDCETSNNGAIILGANATVVGEVFLILVLSNNSPAEFTFEQTNSLHPNAASTNCGIVNVLSMNCADDIYTESCTADLPTAYPSYAEFYNAGGFFGSACSGYIGLADNIYYDNNGSGCEGNARQVVRRYYAADVCGNIAVCTQNVFYPESIHGPIPICPPTIGVSCLEDINVADHLANTQIITDCGLGYTMTVIDSTFEGGFWGLECDFADYIYHVRVTDDCGRSADCELRYTLIGDVPVFEDDIHPHPDTCRLPSLIKECGDPFIDHDQLIEDWINGMTITGTCGQTVSLTTDYNEDNFVYTCGLAGEQIVTFTAEDECGRESTCTGSIINIDTKPPSFSSHAKDVTANCDEDVQAIFDAWLDNNGGANGIDCCSAIIWSYLPENPIVPSSCTGNNSIAITFVASDACGNSVISPATFTVEGEATLAMTTEAGLTEANCSDDAATAFQVWLDNNGGATATACGGITWSTNPENPTFDGTCNQATEVTFIATDVCGDMVSTVGSFTIIDTEAPILSDLPVDLTFFCDEAIDFPQPTTTDNCSAVTVTFTEELNDGAVTDDCNNGYGYDIYRTWTATDACGNATTAQTVAWVVPVGYTGPQFSFVPANKTIGCGEAAEYGEAVCESACGNVVMTFADIENIGDCGNATTFTRTWTGIDDCGNVATASQIFTIPADNEAPVFTFVPESKTIACGETPTFGTPTCTDNCSTIDHLNVAFEDVDLTNECAIQRTWTVTDACGNMSQAVQKITVSDTDAPVLSNILSEKSIACGAAFEFDTPTVSDACSQAELTFEDATETTNCAFGEIRTRTWTATDACGNASIVTQAIRMEDNDAPIFETIVENQVITCGANFEFVEPIANDVCTEVSLTFEDVYMDDACENGDLFRRTWTATDACGNAAQIEQVFTSLPDNTAPEFSMIPQNKTVSCGEEMVFDNLAATDICSGVDLNFTDAIINDQCAFTYAMQRTWTATDACGNMKQVSQIIAMEDNDAPTFTMIPEGKILACGEGYEYGEPQVEDACSLVSVEFEDIDIYDTCAGHSFQRIWTATDACGNASQAVQEFTSMPDNAAPEFVTTPQDKVLDCAATIQFDNPAATDICSGVEILFADETIAGTCENSYAITRTWTATDACGNASVLAQTITIEDTAAPVFATVLEAKTVTCTGEVIFDEATAEDVCSTIELAFEDSFIPANCGNAGTHRRTWTANDICGNAATMIQEITVASDEIAPVVENVLENKTINCGETAEFDAPIANDNCSEITIVVENTESTTTCGIIYTRTWTIADACGNATLVSQAIEQVDNSAPEFVNTPTDLDMTAAEYQIWTATTPEATDACSAVELSAATITDNGDCLNFKYNYTWEATDACGNLSFYSQNIRITDVFPTIELSVPEQLDCGASYDVSTLVNGGLGTYTADWNLESETDWTLDISGEQITINGAEGTAELTLTMTNEQGCAVEESVTLVCQTTSITNLDNETGFTLAPNPTADRVQLTFMATEASTAQIEVYDLLGQQVLQDNLSYQKGTNIKTLDVANFAASTYLVLIKTSDAQFTQKFIKVD